jgi:translation initiation factor 2 beta subunit (eIF-2beta)/eIF-5
MASVNICGTADLSIKTDTGYRYKRPSIILVPSKEFICLINIESIATALGRPVELLTRYMAIKIGTSISNKKGKYMIKCNTTMNEFEKMIDEFTQYFVLCKDCKNPETEIEHDKLSVSLRCKACGNISVIDDDRGKNKNMEKCLKMLKIKNKSK